MLFFIWVATPWRPTTLPTAPSDLVSSVPWDSVQVTVIPVPVLPFTCIPQDEIPFAWVCYCNLEKAMVPYSSILAWKIPWMEEPGGLQSMGSLRVGHNWATSLSLFTFIHWRRKWQPTPVFLPGESQGRGSLVGCRPWGLTGSDTTEAT